MDRLSGDADDSVDIKPVTLCSCDMCRNSLVTKALQEKQNKDDMMRSLHNSDVL